ncbi:MAG TPA: sialidase family protein [Blastocatellia bacterium]|nr:sialidase family protein [Blastocatellia bacterium]
MAIIKRAFRLSQCILLISFTSFTFPNQSHRIVRITGPDALNPCEVSIAINPANPNNIVGVSMQLGKPGQARVSNYAYVTTDAGATWKTVAAQNPRSLAQGDDAVTFDSRGVAYRSYISFDGIRVQRPKRAFSGVYVSSSGDGGQTWNDPTPVVDHINTVTPFEDKPYLVTDNAPDSPHKNNVYLAWTRFDVYGSKDPEHFTYIYFSRSTDGGKSFMMPIRISDTGGDCVDSDNTVEGAVPAVGPKGEVYVVWSGPKGLVFDKSLDGGLTFGKDKAISPHPGGWDINVPGINRCNGMPVTKVDLSNSPRRGAIYVNWIDERNGDPDVFVMSSPDGGETWSAPARVNDDARGNGKAQFFTWMAVDPADGSVNVVFYDRRDQEGTKTGLTLARSTDGGKTFVNYKINQEPFACNEKVFFGDYTGIDAYNGLVTPIYTHFVSEKDLAVSVALFRFKPGMQELLK